MSNRSLPPPPPRGSVDERRVFASLEEKSMADFLTHFALGTGPFAGDAADQAETLRRMAEEAKRDGRLVGPIAAMVRRGGGEG